jgi:hypothetical protein
MLSGWLVAASSLAAKSCACAYIAFLAGIFSWYVDCTQRFIQVASIHSAFDRVTRRQGWCHSIHVNRQRNNPQRAQRLTPRSNKCVWRHNEARPLAYFCTDRHYAKRPSSVYFTQKLFSLILMCCKTFLLRVRKVPGSNLVPDTGYPEDSCGFSQPLQAKAGISPQRKVTTASFQSLLYSSLTSHPITRSYSYWKMNVK